MLRPVRLDPALIGQPLPWDVFSSAGVLLASAGLVLADAAQFDNLAKRTLFRVGENRADSPLVRLATLAPAAETALAQPCGASIRAVAGALLELQRADADACLGYASLVPLARPAVQHALRVLFVALPVAAQLDFSEAEQENLAAAALSMNIACLDLVERAHLRAGPLPPAERTHLHEHPTSGARLLEQLGVTDRGWLDAVRQHHENIDGSGFPEQLQGGQIIPAARLLRVADVYCGQVYGRNYLPPKSVDHAFQALFGREKAHLDNRFIARVLQRWGSFPPGILVRLANREIACISRHASDGQLHWAVSILDGRERPLIPPQVRYFTSRNYAILGTAEREPDWPAIEWKAIWGY